MHEQKLGLTPNCNGSRDAVHVPIISVIVGFDNAIRGERVGIKEVDGQWIAIPDVSGVETVGVLDPWSQMEAFAIDDKVWLCLDPGSIVSLSHNWMHPRVYSGSEMSGAETKLRAFALDIGVEYEKLLSHAQDHIDSGSYWCEGGRFESVSMPDDFWENFSIVTGKPVVFKNTWDGYFFSCSC